MKVRFAELKGPIHEVYFVRGGMIAEWPYVRTIQDHMPWRCTTKHGIDWCECCNCGEGCK